MQKSTGNIVYTYYETEPVEWYDYPFIDYDHVEDDSISLPDYSHYSVELWYIDIGPFFDRFGSAKMPVLINQDVFIRAFIQDAMTRKWIDLKRQEVADAVEYIMSVVPQVTDDIKNAVLYESVKEEENVVLRKLYFND